MKRFGRWRLLRVLLCGLTLWLTMPSPLLAQGAAGPPTAASEASLDRAREFIKAGDYDNAIELLRGDIERARSRVEILRQAYLLLIKTYVFMGNELKFKPQGREASKLHYQAARVQIADCLNIEELRHTRPEPAGEYPQEMISLFAEVRAEIFGSLRIDVLDPADSRVTLDGDSLGFFPGDTLRGDVDLAVGTHQLLARREGYHDWTSEITISPGGILEKSIVLNKQRTRTWYALTIGAALGAVGGLVALLGGGGGGGQAATPLPEAPPPPSN